MNMISKVFGVLLMILGALMALLSFAGLGIAFLVVGLLCIFAGIMLVRKKKPAELPASVAPVSVSEPDPEVKLVASPALPESDRIVYSFKVVDIFRHEKEIIDNLLFENDLYDLDKNELADQGYIDERIYRYEDDIKEIAFELEPDNEQYPDSIKVIADGIHIGYVPEKNAARVRGILAKRSPKITWKVIGGPYKIVYEDYNYENDSAKYVMESEYLNIGIKITLTYKK